MRTFLLALLLVCVALTGAAQTKFRATLPYRNEAGKLLVDVRVNGVPARFLIDTGAPCCVTYSFAQRIGLTTGQSISAQDSNGQTTQAHLVTLDSLNLGGVQFHRLQAMQWGKGNLTEQMGIDGIVGYNLFQMGLLRLDGERHEMTFTNYSRDLGMDPAHALPLLKGAPVPLIPVRLGKTETDTVMFDSGAADFYEISRTTYNRLSASGRLRTALRPLASGTGILSMGAAGLAQEATLHRVKVPRFGLATTLFRNVSSITTDGRDSRIGSDILRYGTVVIDYPKRLFYYRPHDANLQPDLYQKEWEVVLIVENGHVSAGIVWDNRLPIRRGDRILAVNGQRIPDTVDLRTATTQGLIAMPGDQAELTFLNARTGREEQVKIRRK